MTSAMPGEPLAGALGDEEPDWVGKVVSGKYAVLAKLGTGGMGAVYEAENVAVGRKVALKILSAMGAKHADAVERFEREARAAGRIGHPNIIDVLDLGRTEDGVPYIVMERLDGEELYALIRRSAPLAPALAIEIVMPVLSALGAAHAAGIVHRDLKPENVFLVSGPGSAKVKVLDFGVAKFQRGTPEEVGTRLTRAGSLVGTPSYMSPEQAVGKQDVDARSDLYSVGVLLYEMLSAELPHPGDNYLEIVVAIASQPARPLVELAPWLHPGLVEVIERAMARRPEDRVQSAADFAAALEPYAEHTEVGVPKRRPSAARDVSGLRPSASDERAVPGTPGCLGPTAPAVETTLPTPAGEEGRERRRIHSAVASELTERRSGGARGGAFGSVADPPALEVPPAAPTAGVELHPAPERRSRAVLVAVAALAVAGTAIAAYLAWPREEVIPAISPPARPQPAGQPAFVPAPPVVPAPAQTLALDVDSNVPRARVLLDGVLIGETPLHEIVRVQPGAHLLRLEAEGYDPVERTIALDAPQQIRVDLEPLPAKARLVKKRGGGLLFHQDVYRDGAGH